MKYGKLINGELEYAPIEFIENGKRIRGFTEDFLLERGYKPIMFSSAPYEDAIPIYTEDEFCIYQEWK